MEPSWLCGMPLCPPWASSLFRKRYSCVTFFSTYWENVQMSFQTRADTMSWNCISPLLNGRKTAGKKVFWSSVFLAGLASILLHPIMSLLNCLLGQATWREVSSMRLQFRGPWILNIAQIHLAAYLLRIYRLPNQQNIYLHTILLTYLLQSFLPTYYIATYLFTYLLTCLLHSYWPTSTYLLTYLLHTSDLTTTYLLTYLLHSYWPNYNIATNLPTT